MIEFQWPELFYLLPLPILALLLPAVNKSTGLALRIPALHLPNSSKEFKAQSRKSRFILPILIWCALVTSATGPQWLGEPITLPLSLIHI